MMENPFPRKVTFPAILSVSEFVNMQEIADAFLGGYSLQLDADFIGTVIAANRRTIGVNAAEMLCRQIAAWPPDRLAQCRDVGRNAACPATKTGDVITHSRFPVELYNTGGKNGRMEERKNG